MATPYIWIARFTFDQKENRRRKTEIKQRRICSCDGACPCHVHLVVVDDVLDDVVVAPRVAPRRVLGAV